MADMGPDGGSDDDIDAFVEKATAATALNAVYVLSQWVCEQGHPELAERMRANFIIPENPEQPGKPER